jgi:hypothetical protein
VEIVSEVSVRSEKDIVDKTILLCTVALTVIGAAGTCVAIKTLKAINRQALYMLVHARHFDKLAKAANDNVRAMNRNIALQFRPRLIVRKVNLNAGTQIPVVGQPDAHPWTIDYAIANTGGTPATLTLSGFHFSEFRDEIPVRLEYDMQPIAALIVLAAGEERHFSIGIENRLTALFRMIGTRGDHFDHQAIAHTFFWGCVQYTDDNGILRNTAVCRHYDLKEGRFTNEAGQDYEYAD